MKTRTNNCLLAVSLLLTAIIYSGCSGGENKISDASSTEKKTKATSQKWNYDKANLEYRLAEAELKLAQRKEAYLVLDFPEKELVIKLGGATVWSYPMNIDAASSDGLSDFMENFMDGEMPFIRPVTEKHLFASTEKSSDSVLSIVSQVVRADVNLMQRDIPQRFEIHWGSGLTLEVKTEVAGQPRSKLKNAVIGFRKVLQKPFGEATLSINMDANSALTLYRVADRGLITLIYPEIK